MKKIGFIGLGHMGFPMALNLLKAGYEVKVFDLNDKPVAALEKVGAKPAPDIASVADDSAFVFTMLQTAEQVRACVLGVDGVFANLSPGAVYIDSSSIDIKASKALHKVAKDKNIVMVDAPVSGGVAAAKAASLTFMVGGDEQAFDKVHPVLAKLGQHVIHAGGPGSGEAAKICNNMLLGISMIAVSEAFELANSLGLSPKKLFEICAKSSGQCWSLTSYCPWPDILPEVPSSNEYKPGFTAKMMLKDLCLSQEAAQYAHVNTSLGQHATQLYQAFVDEGQGEVDFSGIILKK